jgi:hypothetical protein
MLSAEKKGMLKLLPKLFLVALLFAASAVARAETAEERENALKAGFLYNFFSYVEWPQKADKGTGPFVVGIVGNDVFAAANAALNGKEIKGRRIEVRKIEDASKLSSYHLVFVSASEEKRGREILNQASGSGVLTVGDWSSGFIREGGVINLVPSRNRLQIEINPAAAEKAGLTISSQLLKLARITKG